VLVISLVSAIAILVGIILEVGLTFSGLAQSITPTAIQIKPLQAAALIGILTATVVVTQLITAALSAYATNTKEANASIGSSYVATSTSQCIHSSSQACSRYPTSYKQSCTSYHSLIATYYSTWH